MSSLMVFILSEFLQEQLYVVELDQGDGWTRVRRQNSLEEGFVPTSYVRITLYSNC